jgi:dimeric dUTPase (all-alpha-NTP-PPase superfamily)
MEVSKMIANLKELVPVQREVNRTVREKLDRDISANEFLLALNVELFEYFNAVGTWKWWKHSHTINREKILDELADCFAFFLSLIDLENIIEMEEDPTSEKVIAKVEAEINDILETLDRVYGETKTPHKEINDLITYIGTDNEIKGVLTVERFAIAIFIVTLLFEDITWEEISEAYLIKSQVNVDRQVQNY